VSLNRSDFAIANHFPFARGYGFIISVYVLFVPLGSDRLITSNGDVFKVRGISVFVLFVPLGSDRIITLNGDVFKVRG